MIIKYFHFKILFLNYSDKAFKIIKSIHNVFRDFKILTFENLILQFFN